MFLIEANLTKKKQKHMIDSYPGSDPSYFQDRTSEIAASITSQIVFVAWRIQEISKELSFSFEATQELAIKDIV